MRDVRADEDPGDVLADVEGQILADVEALDPTDHSERAELLRAVAAGVRARREADAKWEAREAERQAQIPEWRKQAARVAAEADAEVLDARIPAEAFRPCQACETGTMRPSREEAVHCDEGDGSASVGTRCDNRECSVQSGHSWALTDQHYREEFGHEFDEDLEDLEEAEPTESDPAVPADASAPCRSCGSGTVRPATDKGVWCREGELSAATLAECDSCDYRTSHEWEMSPAEYERRFGKPFPGQGENQEVEEQDQQPLVGSIGGSSLSIATPTTVSTGAGETVDPASAINFSEGVAQKGVQIASAVETVIGNLTARGVTGEPITHLQRMLEKAQAVTSESEAAKTYFEGHLQIQEVAQSDKTIGGADYLNIHE